MVRAAEAVRDGRVAAMVSASNTGAAVASALLRVVAFHGALNSLGQVVLKVAAPGIPDVYQGTELWNLRLTDPDNRFDVDLGRRAAALEDLDRRAGSDVPALIERLLRGWADGRLKLFVLSRALRFRAVNHVLFERGAYLPLEVDGSRGDQVVAFARRHRRRWTMAVVPRLTTRVTEPERFPLGPDIWETAAIRLPDGAPDAWTDVLTGHHVDATRGRRPGGPVARLADAFASLPVALLRGGDGP